MRANADRLGIDPEKIVIEGNSAGAHLVLMAAGTPGVPEFSGAGGNAGVSEAVAAVIAFYPPTAFEGRHYGDRVHPLWGRPHTAGEAHSASPLTYASASYPPTLLIHGNADQTVPSVDSTLMYEALHGAGAPVELHMYAKQPHAFDSDPLLGRQCADIMALFIDRVVRG